MTTRNNATFKVCHMYVYHSNKGSWSAGSCVYVDPREIRKFYDCIRICLLGVADCVLTETLDGFRIEVFKYECRNRARHCFDGPLWMLLFAVFYRCGDSFKFTAAGNWLLVGR